MFGYKLVKVEKEQKEGNENNEAKKTVSLKDAAKTAGKVLGTGLLVAGAFFVGKGLPDKKGDEPEAETETETTSEDPDIGTDD